MSRLGLALVLALLLLLAARVHWLYGASPAGEAAVVEGRAVPPRPLHEAISRSPVQRSTAIYLLHSEIEVP